MNYWNPRATPETRSARTSSSFFFLFSPPPVISSHDIPRSFHTVACQPGLLAWWCENSIAHHVCSKARNVETDDALISFSGSNSGNKEKKRATPDGLHSQHRTLTSLPLSLLPPPLEEAQTKRRTRCCLRRRYTQLNGVVCAACLWLFSFVVMARLL